MTDTFFKFLEMSLSIFSLSYLLGSIPFGLVLSKIGGYGDLRYQGSGNIGATNAFRIGGTFLGILTLLFDLGKGMAALLGAQYVLVKIFQTSSLGMELLAAYGAILGHIFPVWLKFKGGKGVATALGTLFVLSPPLGGMVVISWLLILGGTRYSSLSSLGATLLSPFYGLYFLGPQGALGLTAIALLIFYRHKENIKRLRTGQEPKIHFSSKVSS